MWYSIFQVANKVHCCDHFTKICEISNGKMQNAKCKTGAMRNPTIFNRQFVELHGQIETLASRNISERTTHSIILHLHTHAWGGGAHFPAKYFIVIPNPFDMTQFFPLSLFSSQIQQFQRIFMVIN